MSVHSVKLEALDLRTDENEYDYEIYPKIFARVLKKTTQKASFYFFSPKTLVRLFILKKVKPSPNSKMIKLLTFDNLFPPLRHSR